MAIFWHAADFFTTLFYACCVCISSYQLAAFVQLHSSHLVKVGGEGEENRPWGIYLSSRLPSNQNYVESFLNSKKVSLVFILKQFKVIESISNHFWSSSPLDREVQYPQEIDLLKWTIFQSKYVWPCLILSSSCKADPKIVQNKALAINSCDWLVLVFFSLGLP